MVHPLSAEIKMTRAQANTILTSELRDLTLLAPKSDYPRDKIWVADKMISLALDSIAFTKRKVHQEMLLVKDKDQS
jgi:hypothetical protein